MHTPRTCQPGSKRPGFILPVILIAIALTTAVGGALVLASMRSARGARLAWNGDVAMHAADEALAATAEAWTPQRIAHLAIGARETGGTTTSSGTNVITEIIRVSPTLLWIEAEAITHDQLPALRARRRIGRAIALDASTFEIEATLTTLGALSTDPAISIDAQGNTTQRETTCGSTNDSGSTAALLTQNWNTPDSSNISGTPATRTITAARADSIRQRIWNRIEQVPHTVEVLTPDAFIQPRIQSGACTGTSGEPWRNASALTPCIGHWPLRFLRGTSGTVTLTTSRHQGVLIVEGDLVLHGTLDVRGLLIVRGNIDASAGALIVTGAVVVLQQHGGVTHIGNTSTIRYSRCSARRAVTPLALVRTPPVFAWADRP